MAFPTLLSALSPGMTVFTRDSTVAGVIYAVHDDTLIVECGIFIKYLCSFSIQDIACITPSRVELRRSANELHGEWNVVAFTDAQGKVRHITQVGVTPVWQQTIPDMDATRPIIDLA